MSSYKIFKYQVDGDCELSLPLNSKLISVMEQRNEIVVYATIDEGFEKFTTTKTVIIKVVGTGYRMNFNIDDYTFLGTVNTCGGDLMWHVFYKDLE